MSRPKGSKNKKTIEKEKALAEAKNVTVDFSGLSLEEMAKLEVSMKTPGFIKVSTEAVGE